MRDEEQHAKLRRKMAPGVRTTSPDLPRPQKQRQLTPRLQYSGKENESIAETVDTHVARLISLFDTKYTSAPDAPRPVDFAEKVQFFTLDVIGDLAFGQAFGFIEGDADMYDFISTNHAFFPFVSLIANSQLLVTLLHSRALSGLLPKATDKVGFGAFIGYDFIPMRITGGC